MSDSDTETLADTSRPARKGLGARLFAFFTSYGLATILLALLLLLTWLGTLAQKVMGLHMAQKKFFDSLFFIFHPSDVFTPIELAEWPQWARNIAETLPIPLPGVYLVLAIFTVNLVLGGLVHIRKGWKMSGVILSHFSMVLLIVAGAVSFHKKSEGVLRLNEGASGQSFISFDQWQVEVQEISPTAQSNTPIWVIPESKFKDLGFEAGKPQRSRTFHHKEMPMELTISGWRRNMYPMSAKAHPPRNGEKVIGDYYIAGLPINHDNEPQNIRGLELGVKDTASGQSSEHLLTGDLNFANNSLPVTLSIAGKSYAVALVRKSWPLPFKVTLKEAEAVYYPGTQRPKEFKSDIVATSPNGTETPARIQMNEPLRRDGFILFQTDMGMIPDPASSGRPLLNEKGENAMFSGFTVVTNPSDHWPTVACIMSLVGLLIHFLIKLGAAITKAQKRQATQSA